MHLSDPLRLSDLLHPSDLLHRQVRPHRLLLLRLSNLSHLLLPLNP